MTAGIDDDVVRIARNRARLEIGRQDQELKAAIGRVKSGAAAAGVGGSGIPLLRIASLCADAAVARGDMVWRILHRAIATAGVHYEPYLETELKSIAEEFPSPYLSGLRDLPREAACGTRRARPHAPCRAPRRGGPSAACDLRTQAGARRVESHRRIARPAVALVSAAVANALPAQPVTAPMLAGLTSFAYLPSTPLV